jgi:hypothetical protein
MNPSLISTSVRVINKPEARKGSGSYNLVLPYETSGVATVRARLRSKARSVRSELEGKVSLGQHSVAHDVGEGNLGGGDQVHVLQRFRVWGLGFGV